MNTKQLVFTKERTAERLGVECLAPAENGVTVELAYSAISSRTEKANFIGARNRTDVSEEDRAVYSRTVGYSASGTVAAVGVCTRSLDR